jgi:hypothetical protein
MGFSPVKVEELSFMTDSEKCEGRFSMSRAETTGQVENPAHVQKLRVL